jgi:hypothetical protein
MDSHPKVMTVSYGTFACTLDGFDDPFTTMQLVAEYFRKLSADDRYFGGEPLQPDASKLHQIAMSANPNRIDAEVSDNSVILRQADIVDAPSKVNTLDTDVPAQETTPEQPAQVAETPAPPVEDPVDTPDSGKAGDVSSPVRKPKVDVVVTKAKIATPKPEPEADAIIASLNENLNDTTTADELSPSLEDEIPSETVSAAIKALKSGEAIDRWLETANEKMSTPEHVSKANALERLKAAVAATEAERATRMESITSEVVETGEERRDNTISFRRELAKVRKAYETETSIFSRPKARRVASGRNNRSARPLVLDLGQRIDHSQQATETRTVAKIKKKSGLTLVKDTEVSASPNSAPEQTNDAGDAQQQPSVKRTPTSKLPSFDMFSKIMGASTLIELLEASAAYMTLVLGKDSYSEEQISDNLPEHIKKIVKKDERISTLDRLSKRGFIETVDDGQYAISIARKAAYQKKYLAG